MFELIAVGIIIFESQSDKHISGFESRSGTYVLVSKYIIDRCKILVKSNVYTI